MPTKTKVSPRFSRRTFQGAYEFTWWEGNILRTMQVFADNKREALAAAREAANSEGRKV